MSRCIADMAAFRYVMDSSTDYEASMNARTSNYNSEFNSYLKLGSILDIISAYDMAKDPAYDATFDLGGDPTNAWMDQN